MAKGKPRTATKRLQNRKLAEFGSTCEWWDGGYPECSLPWSHGKECDCNGNPFVCRKLYYKYLASTRNPDQKIVEEFESRKMSTTPELAKYSVSCQATDTSRLISLSDRCWYLELRYR